MMGGARIGVYICHCGSNIADKVDVAAVRDFAAGLEGVVVGRDYKYMCADPGQELIRKDIRELEVNRVVVASCSPRLHEPTFRRACAAAGLNGYLMEMANIREQCSWVTEDKGQATQKARRLVASAVRKAAFNRPLEDRFVSVNPDTLVVGGGIAGIEAALKIAESGHVVHLVEREPSIGGNMAKFDKTFPTMDCAACILTPKMVAAGQNENMRLYTSSEVTDVSGYVGNFKVKISKRASYVDPAKCTACGDCAKVCPVDLPDPFNEGMSTRKAAYKMFAQAVPNVFNIEKKEQAPCRVACPAGVNVQGYIALIRGGKYAEALELVREAMPLPGICGRVCFQPCEAECRRSQIDEAVSINALKRFLADFEARQETRSQGSQESALPGTGGAGKRPEAVAVIGSGPAGLAAAHYLASVGYPVTVFESQPEPGGLLRYGIPAYRLPKDILNREIRILEKAGIQIRTGTSLGRDVTLDGLRGQGYRAVFLATGATAEQSLGIEGEDLPGVVSGIEFLRKVNAGETVGDLGDVLVIGGGNAAVDAARSALRLGARSVEMVYRRSREEMPASPWEVAAAEEEGVKARFLAAPVRILAGGGNGAPGAVELLRMELGDPDASGRRAPVPVKGSNFTLAADTVIVAIGQAPTVHFAAGENLRVTSRGGLWIDDSYQTSIEGVFAGGDVTAGPSSVVEAVAGGHKAAEAIRCYLQGLPLPASRRVSHLKPPRRAPDVRAYDPAPRHEMPAEPPAGRSRDFREVERGYAEETARAEARRCLDCGGCSECLECVKACQAGAIDHSARDEVLELEVGNIILATGYELLQLEPGNQWGYGKFPDVISGLAFERMSNASGPTGGRILCHDGREPRRVAVLHCVGSRDKNYKEYCSRVCCMASAKFAHLVREKTGAEVYEFYIDMRSFGKGYEEFYNRVQEEGVRFIRGKGAEVAEQDGSLVIRAEDTLLGAYREIPVDLVVLSTALVPRSDAGETAHRFGIQRSADGFFMESHIKLDPVKTATDGIYLAGACQSPKDIPDSVAQGAAAAAEALGRIALGKVKVSPVTATNDPEVCSGCKVCISLCPYQAISFDEERKVAVYNEAVCKGCGTCVASCPTGSASMRHFETEAIMAMIEGVCAS